MYIQDFVVYPRGLLDNFAIKEGYRQERQQKIWLKWLGVLLVSESFLFSLGYLNSVDKKYKTWHKFTIKKCQSKLHKYKVKGVNTFDRCKL